MPKVAILIFQRKIININNCFIEFNLKKFYVELPTLCKEEGKVVQKLQERGSSLFAPRVSYLDMKSDPCENK